ncbi:hypothetical protein UP17_10970 [Peribacillus simplex]|uniref:Uncharacterized protein n=1 Tax=Peribacillus simplex TaxID=1478 RepID=A0AAW7IG07_9BACI|nr:hypothetical protein [Peribacillus simplex]AMM92976.1 hypothetical protein UP17_10970 [Peribacillus simplex]MDM5453818.1 hypothetical protein [Peribacillus simplex]
MTIFLEEDDIFGNAKVHFVEREDLEYLSFILRNGMVTAKNLSSMNALHKVGVYLGTIKARKLTNVNVTVPNKATIYTMQHDLLITDLIHELQSEKQAVDLFRTKREIRFSMLGEGDNQSKLKAYNDNRDRIPDAVFFLKELMGTSTTWVVLELNKKDHKRYDYKIKMFDDMLSDGRRDHQLYSYDQVIFFANDVKIHNAINQAKQRLINARKITVRNMDMPE